MPQTALFVIDVQVGLADHAENEVPHASRIRQATSAILTEARGRIDNARANGDSLPLHIIFVQHEEPPESGSLVRGSAQWELVFQPRENDNAERVVAKSTSDAFASNPKLAEQLRSEGVEHIVAFGIQSECCVQATCEGALAAGFKATVLKGAHSTYNGTSKEAVEIERQVEGELERKGGKVIAWEDF